MEKVKAPDVDRPKEKTPDFIPEGRLREILSILFPYGYSHYDNVMYTGVSPYIGGARNIITVVANDPGGWGSVFSICMVHFNRDFSEADSLGFYKGVMKLIAPELYCDNDKFEGKDNVLDFNWADDKVYDNAFHARVVYDPRSE